MPKPAPEDPRLTRLTKLCLALPETTRELRGNHADFRVRKKVFTYFLNDHHGDGIVSLCCKSALGENVDRASREPARFYLPAYIGVRGWFGLRLDRGPIDWREIENILQLSYCLAAPKTLARLVEQGQFTGH
jgi:predicted DNA-binding protein (MmcQ/YjbR family)